MSESLIPAAVFMAQLVDTLALIGIVAGFAVSKFLVDERGSE